MDISKMKPNREKVVFLARRLLPELVCDAVNLEGISYTLPEVQTLLDGVTVGGHRLTDQTITLNQANAWKFLFELIKQNQFSLSKATACSIHALAAREDALEWGKFRTGSVTISGTNYMPPKPNLLDNLWQQMVIASSEIKDIYERAIFIFLEMSKNQFFYDVNKRMGRFMMNGLLLDNGYPVINVKATRQKEFNTLMIKFYETSNYDEMTSFMLSCMDERVVEIMKE